MIEFYFIQYVSKAKINFIILSKATNFFHKIIGISVRIIKKELLIDIYDRIDSLQPGGGTDFTGATSSTAGKHGLVPAPQAGEQGKFLKGDGTWADVSGGSSELTSDLAASIAVGGITAGKSYPQGTSLEQILRDLLSPSLYPTLTNPSATITGTGAKLLEKVRDGK